VQPSLKTALAAAASLAVLVATPAAFGDNIIIDGDELSGSNATLNLGGICRDDSGSGEVSFRLDRAGSTQTQVWGNSKLVSISTPGASNSQGTVTGTSTGATTLSDWVTDDESADQSKFVDVATPSTIAVSVPAGAADGAGSATLTYTGTGAGFSVSSVSRKDDVAVSWTVLSETNVACNPDDEDPVVTITVPATDGDHGWFVTSPVNVGVSATDNVGVTSLECSVDSGTPATVSNPGTVAVAGEGTHSVSCTASDAAGNTGSDSDTVKIDLNNPELNITGAADGTAFDVCTDGVPTRPTFSPSDTLAGSGVDPDPNLTFDSWTPSSTPSGVGSYVYSAQASDIAGRDTAETRTYTVTYGSAFSGVLQPINADGTSKYKLGQTIPVKFKLTCNGVPISDAVARLRVSFGDNKPDPGTDEAPSTSAATEGNLFRYDATAGQYIFNLSTKAGLFKNPDGVPVTFTQGTWTLHINLDDGVSRRVNIQITK
jgi:hypothetical protein